MLQEDESVRATIEGGIGSSVPVKLRKKKKFVKTDIEYDSRTETRSCTPSVQILPTPPRSPSPSRPPPPRIPIRTSTISPIPEPPKSSTSPLNTDIIIAPTTTSTPTPPVPPSFTHTTTTNPTPTIPTATLRDFRFTAGTSSTRPSAQTTAAESLQDRVARLEEENRSLRERMSRLETENRGARDLAKYHANEYRAQLDEVRAMHSEEVQTITRSHDITMGLVQSTL